MAPHGHWTLARPAAATKAKFDAPSSSARFTCPNTTGKWPAATWHQAEAVAAPARARKTPSCQDRCHRAATRPNSIRWRRRRPRRAVLAPRASIQSKNPASAALNASKVLWGSWVDIFSRFSLSLCVVPVDSSVIVDL